jgi:glycosyltransferase involved in cell wall biosynthesis
MPPRDYELALVMPVYNEEGCIAAVVRSWRGMLCASGINFVMIVINDGSRDGTADILQGFAGDERIRVIHQANAGHGPTVLKGYGQAVILADWVFQCDSDNEMGPDSFGSLWEMRHEADAVFGHRQDRKQNLQRSLISLGSRMTVEWFFGRGIEDVNTPYRLMRSSVLGPILECIAPDTLAPNVILCGALTFAGVRVRSVPVPCRPRQTGRASIVRWKLWRVAVRSFGQTLRCSRQIRRSQLRDRCATGVLDPTARIR